MLPAIESLFTRNRDRLQGVRGWPDIARIGSSNLRRLRELLAEDANAAVASELPLSERQEWSQAAEALRQLVEQVTEDKPLLVRFRVESFQIGAGVHVYCGDTPGSLVSGWVSGKVIAVEKAYRPEWYDGSANAGYYWQISIRPDRAVLRDSAVLRCSTSEPRLQHSADCRELSRAIHADPEFFRIFSDNAQRAWAPIWCLERGLQLSRAGTTMRDWFASEV
jgi:hypothetical protein